MQVYRYSFDQQRIPLHRWRIPLKQRVSHQLHEYSKRLTGKLGKFLLQVEIDDDAPVWGYCRVGRKPLARSYILRIF